MPQIADRANLSNAFWRASRGKRETPAVMAFASRLDAELAAMSRELLADSYVLGRFSRFSIRDPKPRVIHAACFRDRVLHHTIINVCGPYFERGATSDSYACRIGKGNHAALKRARGFSTSGEWRLKLDVRRFFDTVDHETLVAGFTRLFKDAALLRLLGKIVSAYSTAPGRGIPIGALTSQYFANYYLDSLDHFVKSRLRCRKYVRFMDDFVLWHPDPDQLAVWQDDVRSFLAERLKLEVKSLPGPRRVDDGMDFLGYSILPDKVLLSRAARTRYVARLAALQEDFKSGKTCEAELQCRANALAAHAEFASSFAWRRRTLSRLLDYA